MFEMRRFYGDVMFNDVNMYDEGALPTAKKSRRPIVVYICYALLQQTPCN